MLQQQGREDVGLDDAGRVEAACAVIDDPGATRAVKDADGQIARMAGQPAARATASWWSAAAALSPRPRPCHFESVKAGRAHRFAKRRRSPSAAASRCVVRSRGDRRRRHADDADDKDQNDGPAPAHRPAPRARGRHSRTSRHQPSSSLIRGLLPCLPEAADAARLVKPARSGVRRVVPGHGRRPYATRTATSWGRRNRDAGGGGGLTAPAPARAQPPRRGSVRRTSGRPAGPRTRGICRARRRSPCGHRRGTR